MGIGKKTIGKAYCSSLEITTFSCFQESCGEDRGVERLRHKTQYLALGKISDPVDDEPGRAEAVSNPAEMIMETKMTLAVICILLTYRCFQIEAIRSWLVIFENELKIINGLG